MIVFDYRSVGTRFEPATNTFRPMSGDAAPAWPSYGWSRPVWTGSEMILWSPEGHGARYDPCQDAWRPISTRDSLSPLFFGDQWWTGSEMLVWSGGFEGEREPGGAHYDPAADRWSPAGTEGAPSTPANLLAVWTGRELLVVGRTALSRESPWTGGRYDPRARTWSSISLDGMPFAQSGLVPAVWTGSEMVVWDPYGTQGGGRYDPGTDAWRGMSPWKGPQVRSATPVWTGSEIIYWGRGPENELTLAEWPARGARYNPADDTWRAISVEGARDHGYGSQTEVWTGSEMIVWGSEEDGSRGERYDPLTDTWTDVRFDPPTLRRYEEVLWTGTEMIVWGGQGQGDQPVEAAGRRYDPIANRWRALATAGAPGWPDPSYGATAVWTGSEVIVIECAEDRPLGAVYDPAADTWGPLGDAGAPIVRACARSVWTGSEILVWGRRRTGCESGGAGGRYDPEKGAWSSMSLAGAPEAGPDLYRCLPPVVSTGSEMIAWAEASYDLTADAWSPLDLPDGLEPRDVPPYPAWTGSEILAWGDADGGAGVRYDPIRDEWAMMTRANAPRGRTAHSAVWTCSELIVWGGTFPEWGKDDPEDIPLSTGGRYEPVTDTWTSLSEARVPSPRWDHGAVWTGSEMLVWGGHDGQGDGLSTGGRYRP